MSTDEKEIGWQVRIARSPQGAVDIQRKTVVIAPLGELPNDFHKRANGVMDAVDERGMSFSTPIFIGVLGDVGFDESSAAALTRGLFNEFSSEISEAHKLFTMLPSLQAYRSLIEYAGLEGARQILEKARDLVFAKELRPAPRWANDARRTKTFALLFMRTSEAFFAFHNAGSILRGLKHENIGNVSKNINLRFRLDSFSNPHSIDFTFDPASVLPKRIAVLIGENGTGKSQALNRIVKFALEGRFEKSENDGESPQAIFDPNSDRLRVSRIVAISTPGETSYTFPPRPKRELVTEYRRLTLGRGSRRSDAGGLAGMLLQLARTEESIRNLSRWDMFIQAISQHLPVSNIVLHARPFDEDPYENLITLASLQSPASGERRLELWSRIDESKDPVLKSIAGLHALSSGQLAFLRFAVQACLHIENGTLVLLDEPETHLHPNLISAFVDLLDKMLEMTGSIAILATHSAYLVREVPRSQVHVVRKMVGGGIEICQPRLKTFGADVGMISTFIFEDEISNRLIEKVRVRLPPAGQQREDFLAAMSDDLSDEAQMDISGRD